MPWVEKIFQKLTLTFGRDFLGRWEGVPIEEVKADWAHELRGLQQNPAAIAYGLENVVKGKPPTVQEFRAACNRMTPLYVSLPAPTPDAEIIAAEVAKMQKLKAAQGHDFRAWAKRLKARHEAGDNLTRFQVNAYREALGEAA